MSLALLSGLAASTYAMVRASGLIETSANEDDEEPQEVQVWVDPAVQLNGETWRGGVEPRGPNLSDRFGLFKEGVANVAQGVAEGATEATVRQLPFSGILYDYNSDGFHLTTGGRVVVGLVAAYAISRMVGK